MTKSLKFGNTVENIAASDRNPIKRGIFVRYVGSKMAEYVTKEGSYSTPADNLRLAAQSAAPKKTDECDLASLWEAIIDNTQGNGFWLREILLSTIARETGFNESAQSAAPDGMTSANLAALIHEARFPEGKDAPNYTPFLHEDRNGREYCLRIARKILECCALYPISAAPPPSPPEVVGWQHISTAPRDGTPVLLGFPGHLHAMHGHCEDDVWGQIDSDFGFEHLPTQPTHWMPLPKGPSHEG